MAYHTSAHKKQEKLLFNALNFFIIIVIAFSLFLLAGFYVVWKNTSELNNSLNTSAEISLYLKKNINQDAAIGFSEKLKLNEAIMDIKLIAPDDGIKGLTDRTGFDEILLGFKENPLPYVIIVHPKLSELSENQIKVLVDSLKNLPEVETARVDMDWVLRCCHLLNLCKYLLFILGLLIWIGALATFCFTIYIVKRQCFWHSFIGSVLAISLVNFILMKLHDLGFIFQGLGGRYITVFILLVILLNIIISKFSVKNRN